MKEAKPLTFVWIDTLCEYPIYGEIAGTRLYNSSYDVSLPLAAVYLKSYIDDQRPGIKFVYHPRRLYEAQGRPDQLGAYVRDGDVVMTSCSTADSPDARRILSEAKKASRTTVIGGIYPRFCSKEILNWGTADYICTGEGEHAVLGILDQIMGRSAAVPIPGVATAENVRPRPAQLMDLAMLPDPDYSGFPISDFARYMNSAYILATRGCPAPCHFCTSARLYGYSYRMRPVESVVRELSNLHSLGFKKISLADDTVLVDHAWASELFASISAHNPGYRLKVRARADELTPDMVRRMTDAGVEVIQFGVESIQLTTRVSMHKRLEQEAIERAFNLVLSNEGLLANPLYMLAYPGETWEDLFVNANFIKSMGSDRRVMTYLSFTTPYPGTGFAKSLSKDGGIFLTHDLKYYTNKFPVFIPGSMLDDEVSQVLSRLVSCFNDIATSVNNSFSTQRPIPEQFFQDIGINCAA